MRLKKRHWFGVLAMTMVAALLPSSAAAAPTVTPVTSGLDSPRGIAFFHGSLMVGEAGHGGSSCYSPPGAPPEVQLCVGATSQVSRVNSNGTHTPFVSGLFSVRTPEGESLGVSGLSASEDRLLVQMGFTPREAPNSLTLAQQQAGQLISVRSNGAWKAIAPVGTVGFDFTVRLNSPTQELDANPSGVLAVEGGAYVTDAGANTLDWVNERGKVRIRMYDPWLANPPTFPHDAVPTCVVRSEDSLLVGELSGRLLKVHGTSFTPVDVKDSAGNSLLTHVTGCTTDRNGNVYFVNMFGAGPVFTPPPASKFFIGNVVQYNPETGKASMLVDGLRFPNMDTVGPDGNLYVTIGSICGPTPGPAGSPCAGLTGGVIKITLPHGEND